MLNYSNHIGCNDCHLAFFLIALINPLKNALLVILRNKCIEKLAVWEGNYHSLE